jgi:hypothetical protein
VAACPAARARPGLRMTMTLMFDAGYLTEIGRGAHELWRPEGSRMLEGARRQNHVTERLMRSLWAPTRLLSANERVCRAGRFSRCASVGRR